MSTSAVFPVFSIDKHEQEVKKNFWAEASLRFTMEGPVVTAGKLQKKNGGLFPLSHPVALIHNPTRKPGNFLSPGKDSPADTITGDGRDFGEPRRAGVVWNSERHIFIAG